MPERFPKPFLMRRKIRELHKTADSKRKTQFFMKSFNTLRDAFEHAGLEGMDLINFEQLKPVYVTSRYYLAFKTPPLKMSARFKDYLKEYFPEMHPDSLNRAQQKKVFKSLLMTIKEHVEHNRVASRYYQRWLEELGHQ